MATSEERAQFQGYGTPYLTPYQELTETMGLGQRALEAQVAANPLAQRDAAVLAATAVPVAPVMTAAVPNPLVRPPAPLSTMPIDKQIAWQQYQTETEGKQQALKRAALDQAVLSRQNELEIEGVRQATELIGQTGTLKGDDIVNYPLQVAELARKHPIGFSTPQAKAALAPYETIYQNTLALDKETRNRREEAQRVQQHSRLEAARKQAAELGEDASARFFEREKTDPESAITGVMQEGAALRQKNLEAQLINSGMTPEEITEKFQRPEGFMYPAAEAAAKVRVNPAQEASQAQKMFLELSEMRKEARYKPDDPKPNSRWSPQLEEAFQNSFNYYNQMQARANKRAGVQGMGTQLTQPVAVPVTGAKPAPAARPAATPAPPPLNPAYPEQWVGGKRYIKMPDGKLYLSKVQ